MSFEGAPGFVMEDARRTAGVSGLAIHATAVAVNGRALLIRGASKSGKSSLAAALVAASSAARRVGLVGDDRVLLVVDRRGAVSVRPHPRLAGFIERRGLGLVATPFLAEAPVAGLIELGPAIPRYATTRLAGLENFPVLRIVDDTDAAHRRDRVWAWWSKVSNEADGSHFVDKVALTPPPRAEDYTW